MARSRFSDPIEPMDLANMRENGARSLWVQCHQCRHETIMNVDHLPGDSDRAWSARSAEPSAPMRARIGRRSLPRLLSRGLPAN